MKKIYILGVTSSYFKDLKKNYIKKNLFIIFFNELFIFSKILMKIHFKLKLPYFGIWANKKLKSYKLENNEKNILILFDSRYNYFSLKEIRKAYPNIKIVFWFWNKIQKIYDIDLIKSYTDYIYTFDYEDSKKYKIRYREAFYWRKNIQTQNEKYDICYIGNVKSFKRLEELERLYKELNEKQMKSFFYVVDTTNKFKSNNIEIKKEYLDYSKYLEIISNSRAILEIVENNQIGFTLRTLESLFFNKKLLTNNKEIEKYDFFKKENIQILNSKKDIDFNFFKLDNTIVPYKIKDKYYIDNWLKEIIEDISN